MAKILITSFGSYGDLHPYVALAKTLQSRGHEVTIGSSTIFQIQIEAEEIPFTHLRTNLDRYTTPSSIREFLQRIFDPIRGGELMVKEMMLSIEECYIDTLKAVEKADLVISNPLAYATPIICREEATPWLSTTLAPMFFLSVYDPPKLSAAPWLRKTYRLSPALYRGLFSLLKGATKAWVKPLYQLCERYQIPPPTGHPLFEGQYSPHGTLAMFSRCFAEPQPDWPPNTNITGFPMSSVEITDSAKLQQLEIFLQAGEPPIVFALGSAAVNIAEDFYVLSASIARKLNRRAVLVCGEHDDQVQGITAGDDLFIINYVAYEKLFPHACLIVHQGGIGTLAQSLMAQRPILVVPFGFDQFDNGERIEKLGVGKCMPRKDYKVVNATQEIEELLSKSHYQVRAQEVGKVIKAEKGTAKACDVIERLLSEKNQESSNSLIERES